jgi:hypothetical protein
MQAQDAAKTGPLRAEAVGRIDRKLVQEMRDWEAKLNGTANSNLPGKRKLKN